MNISYNNVAQALNTFFREEPYDKIFASHTPTFFTGRNFEDKSYRNSTLVLTLSSIIVHAVPFRSASSVIDITRLQNGVDNLEELLKARTVLYHYYNGIVYELKDQFGLSFAGGATVTAVPDEKMTVVHLVGTNSPVFQLPSNLIDYTKQLKRSGKLG